MLPFTPTIPAHETQIQDGDAKLRLDGEGRERTPVGLAVSAVEVEAEHVVVPVLHLAREGARLSEVQP